MNTAENKKWQRTSYPKKLFQHNPNLYNSIKDTRGIYT